jgi:hypothetical protein
MFLGLQYPDPDPDPDPLVRCMDPDRVGIKKPTQKNPPKKTHLKNPLKMGFFGFFLGFFKFLIFL